MLVGVSAQQQTDIGCPGQTPGHPPREPLTQRRIFWFWFPLAAMWLMMAVEQPAVSAVVARMAAPERNLAAYGVTMALALLLESPIIMLLTAGTALPAGATSYRRLMRFTHVLIGALTVLHLLIATTPLFTLIARTIIGAPEEILPHARLAFLLLLPWTGAIGYRRLWQGVLIRFHRTAVVPATIATRLAVSGTVLGTGLAMGRLPGVVVACAALSLGVIAAAATAYLFSRPVVRRHLSQPEPAGQALRWHDLVSFYAPLALTSLILLASRPILTVGLARSPQPLMSLAAWPVIVSVVFLGRSIAMSYQEAVVALARDRGSVGQLSRFTVALALALAAGFALLVSTPAARVWLARVAALTPPMVEFSLPPMAIMALVPALTALISWRRGLLVQVRRTGEITRSVLLNLSVLVAILLLLRWLLDAPGTILASIALSASVLSEWLYVRARGRAALLELAGGP